MKRKIRSYESDEIAVDYDAGRCIHAEECVKGLPAVFDAGRRPWIEPSAAESLDELARVIERCPTGALQYRWKAAGPAEEPAPRNTIRIEADGPLYVRGALRLKLDDDEVMEETRLALCRCGLSKDKPFCDNSHARGEFADPGRVTQSSLKTEEAPSSALTLEPLPNGPTLISGGLTIEATDGSRIEGTGGALCRCGHSSNKPFCDGTHRKVGFEAP
jgi:CDGSH-type Zn-finger protein/uncharacterized Fe-S cluster protein YjdI